MQYGSFETADKLMGLRYPFCVNAHFKVKNVF